MTKAVIMALSLVVLPSCAGGQSQTAPTLAPGQECDASNKIDCAYHMCGVISCNSGPVKAVCLGLPCDPALPSTCIGTCVTFGTAVGYYCIPVTACEVVNGT